MAEDAGAEAVRGAVRITGIRDLAAFASLAGRAMPAAGAACGPGGRDEVAGGDGSQGAVAGGPGQSAGHGATRVSLRCAACNGENPPQCKFCNHCGMPMF